MNASKDTLELGDKVIFRCRESHGKHHLTKITG